MKVFSGFQVVMLMAVGASATKGSQYCPNNCVDSLKPVCENVEGILESIPFVPSFVDEIVGASICFPKDVKPSPDSLCPKKCGDDKLSKVCAYVDSILQGALVPKFVRNITDASICAFGKNNFQNSVLGSAVKQSKHCPADCVDSLATLCDQVEEVIDAFVFVPEFVKDIVGQSVCFPKDTKSSTSSLCPKKCGKDITTKVCNYVDGILTPIPGVPKWVRNVTDIVICQIADLIDDVDIDRVALTQGTFLRASADRLA